MAERPAPKPAVNDWQPVQASDWQDVNGTPASDAPIDDRNSIQKSFDANTSYQPNDPMLKKVLAGTAHGIGMPFVHPVDTVKGVADSMNLSHAFGPNAEAPKPMGDTMKELPYDLGEGFGGMALTAGLGEGAAEGMAKIPSRTRALATLKSIEQQGAETPVSMIRTPEALADYEQHHLKPGGVTKLPLTRIGERIGEGPMNFPEARDYYSKVSTATRAPGFLGRAFESPEQPQFRAAAGPVREAFNSDLERAADTFGRGEDYTNAMKEYGQNARLRSVMKKAAIAGAGAAAGSAGLGKVHGIASSVLR